ncbi:MAG: hypothetical protein ABIP94_04615 [Planctomycetota bacterium]
MTTLPDGDLVAGGYFAVASGACLGIARWDGSSWLALGSGVGGPSLWNGVQALVSLPNGDLVVGGLFATAGGTTANHIAKWDGFAWSAFGAGIGGTAVRALTMRPNGEIVAGGDFLAAGGNAAAFLARLATTCPAGGAAIGTGCSGSAGPVVLTATTLPWIGGTFRARTTGLTANSLAVGVFGFGQTSIPIASVHPQGLPGCLVLVTDEILIEFMVGNGTVESHRAIPVASPLISATFYHQVAPVELSASSCRRRATSWRSRSRTRSR